MVLIDKSRTEVGYPITPPVVGGDTTTVVDRDCLRDLDDPFSEEIGERDDAGGVGGLSHDPTPNEDLVVDDTNHDMIEADKDDSCDIDTQKATEHVFRIPNWDLPNRDKIYSETFPGGPHGLEWRTLVFPHGNQTRAFMAIYVELFRTSVREPFYGVDVNFQFQVINQVDPERSFRSETSQFVFVQPGSDRGFDHFAPLTLFRGDRSAQTMDFTPSEFVKDGAIEIRTCLTFEPSFNVDSGFNNPDVSTNCRAATGYVGLKNQGATCYMNSLLQTLFHIRKFRCSVYNMPLDDSATSVALSLQKVFAQLQTSEDSVCTKNLTCSFGWNAVDSFMQHDVQEFSRVLCENLEQKMKGTQVDGAIGHMFEGKSEVFIECINVDYRSTRIESFYDLSLNVKGLQNLMESFAQYIEVETLEGENQYRAENFGLQDAKKGVRFLSFPPVLCLQLKRFEYDPIENSMIKLNDRFEFPVDLDLTEFMHKPTEEYTFVLHSVLVHSGSVFGGHYYAYVCPSPLTSDAIVPADEGVSQGPAWFKFDDDMVTRVSQATATENNFGGDHQIDVRSFGRRIRENRLRSSNAYMLVYIRKKNVGDILGTFNPTDIPECVRTRIASDEEEAARQERELVEECRKVTVKFFSDRQLVDYTGIELQPEMVSIKVYKDSTVDELAKLVAENFEIPFEHQLWFQHTRRENRTVRPNKSVRFKFSNMQFRTVCDITGTGIHDMRTIAAEFFVYDLRRETFTSSLIDPSPMSVQTVPILLFFKYFDVETQSMRVLGSRLASPSLTLEQLCPNLKVWAFIDFDLEIDIFEEENAKQDNKVTFLNPKATIEALRLISGDILCFQIRQSDEDETMVDSTAAHPSMYRTVPDYILSLVQSCTVRFFSVDHLATDPGLPINLRKDWHMNQVIELLLEHLENQPPSSTDECLNISDTDGASSPTEMLIADHRAVDERAMKRKLPLSEYLRVFSRQFADIKPNFAESCSIHDSDVAVHKLLKHCDADDQILFYQWAQFPVSELEANFILDVYWPCTSVQGGSDDSSMSVLHQILVPKVNGIGQHIIDALRHELDIQINDSRPIRLMVCRDRGSRVIAEFTASQSITHLNSLIVNSLSVRADQPPIEQIERSEDQVVIWFSKITHGIHSRFYGDPVSVLIRIGATLNEMNETIRLAHCCTDVAKFATWKFFRIASTPFHQILGEDVLASSSCGSFRFAVDQGKDRNMKRPPRLNPLDRPVKIYN